MTPTSPERAEQAPERIWIDSVGHIWSRPGLNCEEYVRSDLATQEPQEGEAPGESVSRVEDLARTLGDFRDAGGDPAALAVAIDFLILTRFFEIRDTQPATPAARAEEEAPFALPVRVEWTTQGGGEILQADGECIPFSLTHEQATWLANAINSRARATHSVPRRFAPEGELDKQAPWDRTLKAEAKVATLRALCAEMAEAVEWFARIVEKAGEKELADMGRTPADAAANLRSLVARARSLGGSAE